MDKKELKALMLNYIEEHTEDAPAIIKFSQFLETNMKSSKAGNSKWNDEIAEIIDYFNSKVGSHYTTKNKAYTQPIVARLNDGFTVNDFYIVIDKKYRDWIGDAQMCKYIRPQTLFGTKFESYLNQQEVHEENRQQQYVDRWANV